MERCLYHPGDHALLLRDSTCFNSFSWEVPCRVYSSLKYVRVLHGSYVSTNDINNVLINRKLSKNRNVTIRILYYDLTCNKLITYPHGKVIKAYDSVLT